MASEAAIDADVGAESGASRGGSFVPGTCVNAPHWVATAARPELHTIGRDESHRAAYARTAMALVPRVLGAVDRNPFRPTYGCFDREFWHYRTAAFASGMHQEAVWPLALVYTHRMPGNRWHQSPRVRELAVAGIRFAARSSHRDGSCDDYYPFERAFGAAAFSLAAAARAYRFLELNQPDLVTWMRSRADWLASHSESGRLANHQAVAALALVTVWQLTGERRYFEAAQSRVATTLEWQSSEGWFEEYGGADAGYQTVTIDALAKYQFATGDARLDEPLCRAVEFARWFLHPDDSYGGEYGSRGTYHFYPHGMELLCEGSGAAADLADGFLRSLETGTASQMDDDRMYVHRLGSLIEAYLDWSPRRPSRTHRARPHAVCHFPEAGIHIDRSTVHHVVISAARGGVFKSFVSGRPVVTDCGLIVETSDGRIAVSQSHDLERATELNAEDRAVTVSGSLTWSRFETATPVKQAALHLFMCTAGRLCRNWVRRLLQRRLITGRRTCPIRLTRRIEILDPTAKSPAPLRVIDRIELLDANLHIRRMSFGSDHQTAYVAAANIYQDAVLQPWVNLDRYIEEFNERRSVTITREL